jgi:hypothetical protein
LTVTVANTANTNTVQFWRLRTNDLASAMTSKVVSVDSNAAVGNAVITGALQVNTLAITSVGSISGNITISTNVTATARVNLGAGANVMITTGNSTHRILVVNSSNSFSLLATKINHADLSDANVTTPSNGQFMVYNSTESAWKNETISLDAVGGSNTHIQFNDSDNGGGEANLTWDKTTSQMSIGAAGKVFIGNSTTNASITRTLIQVSNSTGSVSISPFQFGSTKGIDFSTVNATAIVMSDISETFSISKNTLSVGTQGGDDVTSMNTSQFYVVTAGVSNAFVNSSTLSIGNSSYNAKFGLSGANIGSNVAFTTADLKIGNTTVNSAMNSTSFALRSASSNLAITIPSAGQKTDPATFLHANGSWVAIVQGLTEATNANIWAGTSNAVTITPKAMMLAMKEVTLTDAATVALDFINGINFRLDLGGARILSINTIPDEVVGRSGYIKVVANGASRSLNTSNDAKIMTINGEAMVTSTTNAAVDYIYYTISNTTSVVMSMMRNVL